MRSGGRRRPRRASEQEDTSGGFRHGGWSHPFFDPEVMGPVIGEVAERSEALVCRNRPKP